MNTKLALVIVLFLAMILPVSAMIYYPQNTAVNLKIPCINNYTYCSAAAECNLSIYYPNETGLVVNQLMDNQGSYHNYSLSDSDTSVLGTYKAAVTCNEGGLSGFSAFNYVISWNGKAPPNDNLIIFYIIASMGMLVGLIYLLFQTIEKGAQFKFYMDDFSKNLIAYCALFVLFGFNLWYMGNQMVNDLLKIFISVGAITNIVIPAYALWSSFLKNTMDMRKWGKL